MSRNTNAVIDPLLLVQTCANVQRIARCCTASTELGVRHGMTLAHARALIPAARIEEFEGTRDGKAMRRLAVWAQRFAPFVGVDTHVLNQEDVSDGLILDITGCSRLFGGEGRLACQVVNALRRLGFTARVGVGPTIGSAWGLARFGCDMKHWPISAVPSGASRDELRAAIVDLPVGALRIAPAVESALSELGLQHIGQVLDLPRARIPSRFGSELLLRIDQLFGDAIETFEPERSAPLLRCERVFDGPVTQPESIALALRELLLELGESLASQEAGVRTLSVEFERLGGGEDGTPRSHVVRLALTTSVPNRDAKHLWSLLAPRVEHMHMGDGIEAVALVVLRQARIAHAQTTAWSEPRSSDQRGESQTRMIDLLVNRLGPDHVLCAREVESHIPEQRVRFVPATAESTTKPFPNIRTPRCRPPHLLEMPQPITAIALQPDRPPSALWISGELCRVVVGIGPERFEGEWWKRGPRRGCDAHTSREYFRVQDENGQWLWVYRDPVTGRWFLHGVWC